jgi:hypothetical protein
MPGIRETFRSWVGGVITALRAEDLPQESSPRGRNSTLLGAGLGRAVVGKRRGASVLLPAAEALGTLSPTPLTTATVHSQHAYRRVSSGAYTYTHLAAVKESGDLYTVTPAGVSTLLSAGVFGVNGPAPGWVTFKNRAIALAGSVRKKVLELSGSLVVQNLGIARPPARAATSFNWNATAGGSGVMTGDYELALTFWNDTAQTESSRSDGYTVTGASADQLTVTWATSPDTQITHVRVHIRKIGTNVNFLRVTAGTGYVAGKGVPMATATTVLDLSDATILTFEASPDSAEYDPPAPTENLFGGLIHGGRLLAWSKTGIYWSRFDEPEQFDPEHYEPVAPDDGQELVACHPINENLVAVFKRRAIYALAGTDPNAWELSILDPSVGCVAPDSIVTVEGKTYWWSELGPMMWDGTGAPIQLGYQLLRDTIDPSQTNPAKWAGIVAHVDPPRQQVVFWIPTVGSLVNDRGLPFNYRLGVWESDGWDPLDVASAVTGEDEGGRPVVILGGVYGRCYLWWDSDTDGARLIDPVLATSGLLSGSVASVSGDRTTVYVSAVTAAMQGHQITLAAADAALVVARITTVGGGGGPTYALVLDQALPVGFTPATYIIDPSFSLSGVVSAASLVSGNVRLTVQGAIFDADLAGHAYAYLDGDTPTAQRRRIVAVGVGAGGESWVDVYPTLDYAAADAVGRALTIAGPCFSWDTHWSDSGDPFRKKRYYHTHLAALSNGGTADTRLDVFTSYSLDTPTRTRVYTVDTGGALWDTATFDTAVFGGLEARQTFRTAVGRLANSYRLRVSNCAPNRPFVLLALGMDVSAAGDRR